MVRARMKGIDPRHGLLDETEPRRGDRTVEKGGTTAAARVSRGIIGGDSRGCQGSETGRRTDGGGCARTGSRTPLPGKQLGRTPRRNSTNEKLWAEDRSKKIGNPTL